MWNAARGRAEVLGEEAETSPHDFALEGQFTVASLECEPAFACYKRALDAFTPEHVEAITGVSPDALKNAAALLAPGQRIAYMAGGAASIADGSATRITRWIQPVVVATLDC